MASTGKRALIYSEGRIFLKVRRSIYLLFREPQSFDITVNLGYVVVTKGELIN